MFNEINEKIEVAVVFREGSASPVKFRWHNKEYRVEKVNLRYSRFEGRNKVYYFAVSDSANYFKLCFNTEKMQWLLLETYAG